MGDLFDSDKVLGGLHAAAGAQVSEQSGVFDRATVTALGAAGTVNEGKVKIQLVGAAAPVDVFWPVIAPGYKPVVGDTVYYTSLPGGDVVVWGRRVKAGDRDIADLGTNKIERNGSQAFTGYPNLPAADPTGALHPVKKAQLDRVRAGTDLNDNSVGPRVLGTHATDDTLRAVITDAVRNAAITAAKIADGNVTRAKLGADTMNLSWDVDSLRRTGPTDNAFWSSAGANGWYAAPNRHYHQYSDFAADGLDYTRTAMTYP